MQNVLNWDRKLSNCATVPLSTRPAHKRRPILESQIFTRAALGTGWVHTCYPAFCIWRKLADPRTDKDSLHCVLHLSRHAAVTAHRQSTTSQSLCSVWLAPTLTRLLHLVSGSTSFRNLSEHLISTSWLCFLPWWLACVWMLTWELYLYLPFIDK